MQVGEKERHAQVERLEREILDIVSSKLVDPKSKRVYTPGMIEKALEMLSSKGGAQHKQEGKQDGEGEGSGTAPDDGASKKDMPIWTGVVTTKSAKSQALEAMKALIAWQPIPVSRARMRLRITCPTSVLKQAVKGGKTEKKDDDEDGDGGKEKVAGTVKDKILGFVEQVETQDTVGQEWEVTGFVEPGAYKGLSDFLGSETKGKGRAEVLDMAVVHEGD